MRILAFAAVALVACGGATATDLFGPPGTTPDASLQKDTSPVSEDANVIGPDAGGIADTSVVIEAGPDTSKVALTRIQCGSKECVPGADVCCRSGTNSFTYACVSNPAKCAAPNDIILECSKATNCADLGKPGDVCCAGLKTVNSVNVATGSSCMSASQCDSTQGVIVCDPQAPGNCPNGGNCSLSQYTLPGYDICK